MQRPTASLLIQSDVGQFKNRGSMKKKNIGNLTLIILVVLTALIWLIFPPVREGTEHYERAYAGAYHQRIG